MKKLIWISSLLLGMSISAAVAQDINQVDEQGRKQGKWIKTTPEGVPVYEGEFKDDHPVGLFKRYYEDGSLKAEMEYRSPEEVYTRLYYQGSEPVMMAEGKYIDQKKDSVWLSYDESGQLKSLDTYENDQRNGRSVIYHPNGAVSEETTYLNDERHGEWKQFYPDGTLMAMGTFENGERVGAYLKNYPNGNMWVKGEYKNGFKESTWIYGNEDGTIGQMVVFRKGEEEKQVKHNGTFTEYYELQRPKLVENYKNGKLHGQYIEYHDNGELVEKQVDNRHKGGEIEIYWVVEGQTKAKEANYKEGQLHGKLVEYDEKGKIIHEEQYINGEVVK